MAIERTNVDTINRRSLSLFGLVNDWLWPKATDGSVGSGAEPRLKVSCLVIHKFNVAV